MTCAKCDAGLIQTIRQQGEEVGRLKAEAVDLRAEYDLTVQALANANGVNSRLIAERDERTCGRCEHWGPDGDRLDPDYRPDRSRCGSESPLAGGFESCWGPEVSIYTAATFGCNQWQAKGDD
jgi:hypothetical protein